MKTFFKSHPQGCTIALILFLTFLTFSPGINYPFVNWDDNTHIIDNPQIRSIAPANILHIFTSTVQKTYIPLTILSFAVEYHFVGLNPQLYHFNNLLLHLLLVFLIFRLGLRFGLQWQGAGLAAFIFALHPMRVESVVWATERKDVLYSVLYLGAVLGYLNFQKTKRWWHYGFSLGMGLLSMLAKPMALSLPLILLLCDWFLKGRIKKEDILNKILYLLYIVPITWLTYSINSGVVVQEASSILYRFWSTAFYFKKFFWPVVLVPHYLPTVPADFFLFEYWSSVLMVVAAIVAFWLWPNRWFRMAILWYLGSIFFLLNFDPGRVMTMVADRYMYLPSVGVCFLLGYTAEKFYAAPSSRKWVLWLVIIVGIFLWVKTSTQLRVWKDAYSLWNYTVENSKGSFLAYNNRGRIHERRQEWDLALADYQEAVKINPKFAKTHKNIGMVYENLGDLDAALAAYSKAIELNPRYSGAYNNRGLILERQGKIEQALSDYESAVTSDPNYLLGYANRGSLLVRSGHAEQGIEDLSYVLVRSPGHVDSYINRAAAYLQLKEFPQALKDCQTALNLQPTNPTARFLCSAVYRKMGNNVLALQEAERARALGYPVEDSYLTEIKSDLPARK